MKQVIAIIMSLLITILSALGIIPPTYQVVTEEQWVCIVVEAFGIVGDDPIVAAIEYGVLNNVDYDADAYATNRFVNITVANASSVELTETLPNTIFKANLEDALFILQIAVELSNNQQLPEEPEAEVTAQKEVFDLTDKEYSIYDGKLIYNANDFDLQCGDKFIAGVNEDNISGAAYEVVDVVKDDGAAIVTVAKLPLEEAVSKIDFEGAVEVNLDEAIAYDNNGSIVKTDDVSALVSGQNVIKDKAGELIDKGKAEAEKFLANPKFSFSIKGYKIKVAYSGGRLDLGVAGKIGDHVGVEKYYSLTNMTADAKFNANIAKLDIKEAYLKLNYDLVETTVLEGSYAASVVPEGGFTTEGDTFLEKVKNNFERLQLQEGSGIEVKVCSFDIPIGSTGMTVELTAYLTISVTGRIELIITSNETKGYEVINNRGRIIHESKVLDREFNVSGNFSVVLGLNLSLTYLTYKIIDVQLDGGIGAYVTTVVFNIKTNSRAVEEIPLDVAVEAVSGLDDLEDLRFCANVQLYGILRVSVGQKSLIGKIGLKKTWTIYDRSNAVFAELHIENSGIVDHCTYVAA